jgi:mRNA interferase YafQ
MLRPEYTTQCLKDIKRLKRKHYDFSIFKEVVEKILRGEYLSPKYKPHTLKGNKGGAHECHISFSPDWLLIYKVTSTHVIFERTGSHDELFRNS